MLCKCSALFSVLRAKCPFSDALRVRRALFLLLCKCSVFLFYRCSTLSLISWVLP